MLVSSFFVALLQTGCASQQDGGADCVSPLKFGERTYVWTPAGDHYVTPGDEVGTATFDATCSDSDAPEDATEERTVYAFRDVSPDEAIVVVDAHGKHGTVYRSETTPANGWDPDFQDWLERTGAVQG